MRDFADMDVMDIWCARIDDSDILSMFPADRRALQAKRIAKATAGSSSELVYPKLVDEAGGQPHIREAPTMLHPEETRYPGTWTRAAMRSRNTALLCPMTDGFYLIASGC